MVFMPTGSQQLNCLLLAHGIFPASACWGLLLPGSAGSYQGFAGEVHRGMATTTSLGIAAVLPFSKTCQGWERKYRQ